MIQNIKKNVYLICTKINPDKRKRVLEMATHISRIDEEDIVFVTDINRADIAIVIGMIDESMKDEISKAKNKSLDIKIIKENECMEKKETVKRIRIHEELCP